MPVFKRNKNVGKLIDINILLTRRTNFDIIADDKIMTPVLLRNQPVRAVAYERF